MIIRSFYKGWFNKECNEPYNTINDIDGLRIIGFDNSIYKNSDGFISDYQYNWLKTQLEISNNKENYLNLSSSSYKESIYYTIS